MRIITSRRKLTCLIAGALTALFAMGMAGSASAGGIALGGTRVIYPQGDKQASLAIINSSTNTTFLIQAGCPMPKGQNQRILSLRRRCLLSILKKRIPCVLCTWAPICLSIVKAFFI